MTLITDTASLEALTERLSKAAYITVDTEFMRDSSYYSKLCLVQVADSEGAFAIDTLSEDLDLGSFYDLMFNPDVLKVFHACRQDMEIFFHATGKLPAPIFDTQVAAMVCGFGESAGYETLVKQIAGKSLDKTARFTDWARRPLSDRQLDYALGDVTHLRVVYDRLSSQLVSSKREAWVLEEMETLTSPATYRLEPQDAWKRIKFRSGTPRFVARLQALAQWREEQAQSRDIPRNRVAKDDILLEVSAHPPSSPEALDHVRGLSKGFHASATGKDLWKALQNAQALPDSALPVLPKKSRVPQKTPPIADLLKVLLKSRCDELGVAPKLVANSADIEELARQDDPKIKALTGWRYDVYGRDALALKNGELALTADGSLIEIVEIEKD
ncbi:ribonuclease D [Iodidimonas muriae]|uniref:Ribonuclease D n=1 Tax=Iodidimonas muriae TaxID=261467 RepID=A0ABQ2L984_9PROT|nr:ribonuclease D [Iodidimonas muriae]GER08159.1 ribonuclease D [Kordiimonadales bacterium JCM 17843]GGO06292.1 ribonuclease D [Iodidimonas muriae]